MAGSFKLVMGAAVIGICLGVAGLVFGIVSKKEADELRSDFSQIQELVEKIREVEESSSGLSATSNRIKREVESLREGTQGALDKVSGEMTRVRKELNDSLALARDLQERFLSAQKAEELVADEAPEEVPSEPVEEVAAAEPADSTPADTEALSEAVEEGQVEFYAIQSGDTLSAVASRHDISLKRILEENPDVDPVRLQIGQKIRVPVD